jgi:uncharacterized protein YbaR (Trm112 family)/SAM-dependent methyltransferase
MRIRALDVLVCPLDKSKLELTVWEDEVRPLTPEQLEIARAMGLTPESLSTDVKEGYLVNRRRKILYPIINGIPRLLTFKNSQTERFFESHRDRLEKEAPGFALPEGNGTPGERDVLRSFSAEWTEYGFDEEKYWNVRADVLYKSMDFLLDLKRQPVQGKLVLEVGIGIGGIANYVCTSQRCELFGMDLGFAVDAAKLNFGANPFFHIVQASAFAPPFREGTFDFVYSQGVIHHTFSTKTAFDSISKLPKAGGRLYVWVYSHYDESRTLIREAVMLLERIFRPLNWRLPGPLQTLSLLPFIPLYILHQNFYASRRENQVKYGFREALHSARDRFTPRFIWRHSDDEMAQWFKEAGFSRLDYVSRKEKPDYVPLALTTCTGVQGVRA